MVAPDRDRIAEVMLRVVRGDRARDEDAVHPLGNRPVACASHVRRRERPARASSQQRREPLRVGGQDRAQRVPQSVRSRLEDEPVLPSERILLVERLLIPARLPRVRVRAEHDVTARHHGASRPPGDVTEPPHLRRDPVACGVRRMPRREPDRTTIDVDARGQEPLRDRESSERLGRYRRPDARQDRCAVRSPVVLAAD